MRIKRRIVSLLAASALVGIVPFLAVASPASASVTPVHSASALARTETASAAAAAVATRPSNVKPDEGSLVFGGFYSTEFQCSESGEAHLGLVLSGGVVVDYECIFDGEPGPAGPWELWLLVEPRSCQEAVAVPSKVAPARIVC